MDQRTRPPLDLPAGYRVGDWTLTGLIGSGGWGSVYGARRTNDSPPDGPAAVKFLRTDVLTPGQRTSMDELIHREIRFSQEADHPHLVRTHAAITVSDPDGAGGPGLDGAIALVMDRADRSLQDVFTAAEPGTPLPDAPAVLRGVASGLAHMHGGGWVHGDLKPANILLTDRGNVWLADFGLTAELDGTHAYMPPLGSLDHVPPEWWTERTGERGTLVRPTADLWAFGVLAHQVFTSGLHPFVGGTARARALAAQAYASGAAPLRLDERVPERWRELITECLAPDHAARAALTAEGLAARVEALCAVPRPGRLRRPAVLLAAAVALVAVVGAGVIMAGDDTDESGGPGASVSGAGAGATASEAASTGDAAPGGPADALPGAIPADSDVPAALRGIITQAAQRCTQENITPALIAAMIKAESGFDPAAEHPSSDEYGIAMWTPTVFNAWAVDGDRDGDKDYMSPPDAIPSMAVYVCWLGQRFTAEGLTKNMPALVAAGYRTSDKAVVDARGVPPRVQPHVDEVLRYLAEYTR
ncbi:protein kinase domain-containing protein [Streptomyces liangshanensis]|uniref:protein kinase domain-containing protein n=1 Tax=Streptomyces liangshanensis TaxID=2717324 RepID=UPI0036DF5960